MPPKATIAKPVSRPAAKKKAPVHKLPEPIREGEILSDIQKRQWRLGKSIGVGGFGEIYAGTLDVNYVLWLHFFNKSQFLLSQHLIVLTSLYQWMMHLMWSKL